MHFNLSSFVLSSLFCCFLKINFWKSLGIMEARATKWQKNDWMEKVWIKMRIKYGRGLKIGRFGFGCFRPTWAGLRRKREDESRWGLSSGHCAAQTLRLKAAQLLHEVRALHQRDVREVQVAKNLVFEPEIKFFYFLN